MLSDAADEQRAAVAANEVQAVREFRPFEEPAAREHLVHETGETRRGGVDRAPAGGAREERFVTCCEICLDVLKIVEQLQEDTVPEREPLLPWLRGVRDQIEIGQYRRAALLKADSQELGVTESGAAVLFEAARLTIVDGEEAA